jgi:hypothetical protein
VAGRECTGPEREGRTSNLQLAFRHSDSNVRVQWPGGAVADVKAGAGLQDTAGVFRVGQGEVKGWGIKFNPRRSAAHAALRHERTAPDTSLPSMSGTCAGWCGTRHGRRHAAHPHGGQRIGVGSGAVTVKGLQPQGRGPKPCPVWAPQGATLAPALQRIKGTPRSTVGNGSVSDPDSGAITGDGRACGGVPDSCTCRRSKHMVHRAAPTPHPPPPRAHLLNHCDGRREGHAQMELAQGLAGADVVLGWGGVDK